MNGGNYFVSVLEANSYHCKYFDIICDRGKVLGDYSLNVIVNKQLVESIECFDHDIDRERENLIMKYLRELGK